MDSAADTSCEVGSPIRASRDRSLLAAPPGLSQRATPFIASWRQGIHRMPLLSLGPRQRQPHLLGRGRAFAGSAKRQPTKSIPMLWRAPQTEEKAGARPCLPAARSRTTRPGLSAQGAHERALLSPLHDVKDPSRRRRHGTPATQGTWRHELRARRGWRGKGFPWGLSAARPEARRPRAMVGLGRLERPTSRLSGVRSNHLSYRPESHPERIGDGAGPTLEVKPRRGRSGCAKGRAGGDGALMAPATRSCPGPASEGRRGAP